MSKKAQQLPEDSTTDFGFKKVQKNEKAKKVAAVFHSVAKKYDLMNDLMSFGVHRVWKYFTLDQSGLKPGNKALDVAGGTGDIAIGLTKRVKTDGQVILTDINASMLKIGRGRLIDKGVIVDCVQANAEYLPFKSNYFDCVTIAFGLRNITDKASALASMYRILKPGGRLLVLEFSQPTSPTFGKAYDFYSFNVLPRLGKWVSKDSESYQYLAESIRMHPDQETLKQMILDAGFSSCTYYNMTGGIVALHKGIKA